MTNDRTDNFSGCANFARPTYRAMANRWTTYFAGGTYPVMGP